MEFIINAVFPETDTSAMQGLSLQINSGALNVKWLNQVWNLLHSSDLSSTQSIKSRHTSNILSATDKWNCLSTLKSSGLYSRNPRLNQFKHHDNLIPGTTDVLPSVVTISTFACQRIRFLIKSNHGSLLWNTLVHLFSSSFTVYMLKEER